MTYPVTRSNRPNTSNTRGGLPGRRPLPLAPEGYDKDNEQQMRKQLMETIGNLRGQVDTLNAAMNQLLVNASVEAPRLNFSAAQNSQNWFLLRGFI